MSKLFFYYGAMGSCKTATAITTAYNYVESENPTNTSPVDLNNQNIAKIIKPMIDTRDGVDIVKTRIGLSAKCQSLESFYDDFKKILNMDYIKEVREKQTYDKTYLRDELSDYIFEKLPYKVIILDECQFASKEQIDFLTDIVDFCDIPVLCFGLKTDSNGNLFEGSKRLLEVAEVIEELKTMCWCGRKATCNARYDENGIIRDGKQIMLGSNSQYKALCRKHYKMGILFKPN